METLKGLEREKLHSFDICAGVYALRHDLDNYGEVLAATLEQVRNEHLSYICEGIDKASRTEFVFSRRGDELVYFDDGEWRSQRDMLEAGITAARYDQAIDPRRTFLAQWAAKDLSEYEENLKLAPGEKRLWTSPYPLEVELAYGKDFIRSCGLNPDRRLGFIYQASCNEDSSVKLTTQSVDLSDKEAFSAATYAFESDPSLDMERITEVYDRVLSEKYAGSFYAGRSGRVRSENAWREMLSNSDLAGFLMSGLERLARGGLRGFELEERLEQHIVGVWALFKKRLNGESVRADAATQAPSWHRPDLNHTLATEVRLAYREAADKNEVLIGCGGSLSAKGPSDVLSSIFSSGSAKTEVMKCVRCPLCNRQGVDATIAYKHGEKTITCSKCNRSKKYKGQ